MRQRHQDGTVARLGVMPRWLLADADRWRLGSAGRSYCPLRTPPISEHSHPHDLRAPFGARGPDAYQLHDPGHAVSAHRSTSLKVPSWTRTPNLAAVPLVETQWFQRLTLEMAKVELSGASGK